ncbi:nucleoside diphosphate-linked moiety X motif 8-like isoform X2 [Pecten maximus]|uniref:nucleoside diphosphate-linked moiety X motif 8-like isoform X2 n=1 Tax=Pecten maximus TaxID=6579 RepID=UPI0014585805|nr:nucleoside diphosphate-linked moiety X motif 8-like isoform X2 [Pecten maximus]
MRWTTWRVILWKNILSKSKFERHPKCKNLSTTVSGKKRSFENYSRHNTSRSKIDLRLISGKNMSSFVILRNRHRMPVLRNALLPNMNSMGNNANIITQCRFFSDTTVNPENIFSEENRCRVQGKLTSLKPVKRVVPYREDRKDAAVLIPLCYVNNEPSLLFMVRSWKVPVHKGEVCFPGGMKDDVDLDLSQTALRETFEEIGLSSETVNIWGNMPKIPSKDGKIEVTPYLGFCGNMDISRLVLDDSEVDAVFTRTITSLCDPVNVRSTQFTNGYTLPVFLGGESRIWGMTAILLHQMLTVLAPGMYNFKLRHVRPLTAKPS